jgi:hypothetical protein
MLSITCPESGGTTVTIRIPYRPSERVNGLEDKALDEKALDDKVSDDKAGVQRPEDDQAASPAG